MPLLVPLAQFAKQLVKGTRLSGSDALSVQPKPLLASLRAVKDGRNRSSTAQGLALQALTAR